MPINNGSYLGDINTMGQAVDLTQERGPDPERAPGHGLSSISAGQKCLNAQCGSLSKVQIPWCRRSISVEEEAPDEDSISNRLGKINNKDCGIVKINAVTFCSDNRAIDVGA